MESWHFWFEGRRRLVDSLLERSGVSSGALVLDLGCGTGHNLARLLKAGYRAVGVERLDVDFAANRDLAGACLIRSSVETLPLADATFDAVLLLDVIEHVDDRVVLAEATRVLRPGGVIILTVPALPGLWSYRDVSAGHRRRYTFAGLRRAIQDAGLDVVELRYCQFLLLPLLVASRILARLVPGMRDREERPGPIVNALFTKAVRLESWLANRHPLPVGSSLAAIARKPRGVTA